ncbi:MAG: NAD-dependent epimerase/dehydratase family protein [Chitinophagaceae bacterium]
MRTPSNAFTRIVLTGATGMVGEGVLHECLQDNRIAAVLVIGRRTCGYTHPKLKEIIHADFTNLAPIEDQLVGYNACLFCSGVSSVGMKEAEFYKLTYTLTLAFAQTLVQLNPAMVFCYISGSHTDSTEKGKRMWARVKGKTENDLMKLPFRSVYNFRPGVMKPTKGLKNTLGFYKWFGWLLPVIKLFASSYICTLQQLGMAMINAAYKDYGRNILEVKDIISLSRDN